MLTLRLTQLDITVNRFAVEAVLEDDRNLPLKTTAEFDFVLSAQEREDLRWYLEDYLQQFSDPAPKIATHIEQRIADLGTELFKGVFETNSGTRELWSRLSGRLAETRIEIVTPSLTSLPWELLRDPVTNSFVMLNARAFVRSVKTATRSYRSVEVGSGQIRILLVICRPGGPTDVPFRAVASRVIKALGETARTPFQLEVLRPPTFEQLSNVLRRGKENGTPYHIVHFDGHGVFANLYSHDAVAGRGYLLFENEKFQNNTEFINGTVLGKILAETEVPILVLNACRSAHVEAPQEPVQTSITSASTGLEVAVGSKRTRAFGSFAQEVISFGVSGVVAMRYNVYVVTAAQFLADLYRALAEGDTLGEAVTRGRKQLAEKPLRKIAFNPRPLQDWIVPIVYESSPVKLLPRATDKPSGNPGVNSSVGSDGNSSFDEELRSVPEAGFFGRDETLLAIDRTFDSQNVVLVSSLAGSGKTSTAAEFARWYQFSGGCVGPFLFTSFDQYKPLQSVLNETIGRIFYTELQHKGINWLTLSAGQRRDVTLKLLSDHSVLWVWDNVESISGFPTRDSSTWTDEQQRELAEFLRAAAQTKVKFLLTSRHDEREWLGDLPARVTIPPMPMQERVQMAEALAARQGIRSIEIENWLPLLRFTEGNPLTLLVLVNQGLYYNLTTMSELSHFVARLQTGEAEFDDVSSEGRTKSLSASLNYGFTNAFNDTERKQLSLLHLFRSFLDVPVVCLMLESDSPWCITEGPYLTKEEGIELFDRAARVGLLTAYGTGHYSIHPVLPSFFKKLFEHYFGVDEERVAHSFVEILWRTASQLAEDYTAGDANVVVSYLHLDQFNLLNGLRLARKYKWNNAMVGFLQGLYVFYKHTGNHAEWTSLLNDVKTEFVDPKTDLPIPGRERGWFFINQRRAVLAQQLGRMKEAKRLQIISRDLTARWAASAFNKKVDDLDPEARDSLRAYMTSLSALGDLQLELRDLECVANFKKALAVSQRLQDQLVSAGLAGQLGSAHLRISEKRDLDEAERWLRTSLELQPQQRGRAQVFALLGRVAYERASQAGDIYQHFQFLEAALQHYKAALRLIEDEVGWLGLIHHQLGGIYYRLGEEANALFHFHKSIPYAEQQNDRLGAAVTTLFIGKILQEQNRLPDARAYAYAALSKLEQYGEHASREIYEARKLIAKIERRM